ncbi:hypothetical protein M3N64_01095 [Sporolactobacillus sp. CPB3-1]|uniref:Uncharacterized protein n=1 Tax=Sporolactobacillus mangiferae TaxID=2940498 RepID=A0ABT0M7B7_9BACL|nr:hypothetical protein [Sporolactobacillus mangiferae]MCL1630548.1 hypothetical protein [Sporolactobacillus mangiferae]
MIDALNQLVGKKFKPHELDEICARITGGAREFKRLYWEDIVGLENMSYRTKSGMTYVVSFKIYKDDGECDSILEVSSIDVLDQRIVSSTNNRKLYVILISIILVAVTVYCFFSVI